MQTSQALCYHNKEYFVRGIDCPMPYTDFYEFLQSLNIDDYINGTSSIRIYYNRLFMLGLLK